MTKINKKILLLLVVIVITFVSESSLIYKASTVGAEIKEYTLLEPLPCVDSTNCGENGLVKKVDMTQYLGSLFRLIIALSAVASVLMITWGGFQYLMTEAVFGKSEAKKTITNAIYGLLMVFASYLILKTIDPNLVTPNGNILPPITVDTSRIMSMFVGVDQKINMIKSANASIDALQKSAQSYKDKADYYKKQYDSAVEKGDLEGAVDFSVQAQENENLAKQKLNEAEDMRLKSSVQSTLIDIESVSTNSDKLERVANAKAHIASSVDSSIEYYKSSENSNPEKVKELEQTKNYYNATLDMQSKYYDFQMQKAATESQLNQSSRVTSIGENSSDRLIASKNSAIHDIAVLRDTALKNNTNEIQIADIKKQSEDLINNIKNTK